MIALLTSLSVASASEPTGPESLELPYVHCATVAEVLREEDDALMVDYMKRARSVMVGKVVAVRSSAFGQQEIATLLVEESLRGAGSDLVDVAVPLDRSGGKVNVPLIEGYRLLVFLDSNDTVIDGQGLFFLEGGFAWRNRTEDVFLRPSVDRVWTEGIDPTEDYIAFPMARLRDEATQPQRRRWWIAAR